MEGLLLGGLFVCLGGGSFFLTCVCVCICVHICHKAHVEVKRQLAGNWFSSPIMWFPGVEVRLGRKSPLLLSLHAAPTAGFLRNLHSVFHSWFPLSTSLSASVGICFLIDDLIWIEANQTFPLASEVSPFSLSTACISSFDNCLCLSLLSF